MALPSLTGSPQFSPRSLIRALWKHKLFILLLSLAGTGATVVVVRELPPVYTAKAVILVESQKIPENFVAATVQTALEAQLDTLKQQVLSRDRLWGLIEELELYQVERNRLPKEEVLRMMRQEITISLSRGWSARGPGAFQVEFQAGKAKTAADVANQIGMFFINENLRQRTAEAAGTSEFLDGQLAAAESRLREQEAKLKEFKLSHNGELPEQEGALLASVAQNRTELLGIQEALGRAQQNKLILESSLAYVQANLRDLQQRRRAAANPAGPAQPVATNQPAPATALDLARSELSRLRARYQNSHPEVQRMAEEVDRLNRLEGERAPAEDAARRADAPAAAPSGPEPARTAAAEETFQTETNRIQELKAQLGVITQEIQNLEQRRQRVLQEVSDTQGRIRNLPLREQQLAVITRDYDTSKTNYQSLLNKKLAADIATDMERWHKSQKFVMLDPAREPQKPTRPRRAAITAAGAVLSLGLGSVLALLVEFRRNALLGEWELPAGTLVLCRIPRFKMNDV